MLEQKSFLVELTENFGAELQENGQIKTTRKQLDSCAKKCNAAVSVSHAKNFALGIHIPTISIRRIEKKGTKTETETLYFSYEGEGEAIITDPAEWGRIPTQIFG